LVWNGFFGIHYLACIQYQIDVRTKPKWRALKTGDSNITVFNEDIQNVTGKKEL